MNLDKMAEVLKLLKKKPRPTYKEIREQTGVPERTLTDWVRKMRNQGIDVPVTRGRQTPDLTTLK
jgi:transposase